MAKEVKEVRLEVLKPFYLGTRKIETSEELANVVINLDDLAKAKKDGLIKEVAV